MIDDHDPTMLFAHAMVRFRQLAFAAAVFSTGCPLPEMRMGTKSDVTS